MKVKSWFSLGEQSLEVMFRSWRIWDMLKKKGWEYFVGSAVGSG